MAQDVVLIYPAALIQFMPKQTVRSVEAKSANRSPQGLATKETYEVSIFRCAVVLMFGARWFRRGNTFHPVFRGRDVGHDKI